MSKLTRFDLELLSKESVIDLALKLQSLHLAAVELLGTIDELANGPRTSTESELPPVATREV